VVRGARLQIPFSLRREEGADPSGHREMSASGSAALFNFMR
jgi:hypothetical protein